MSLEQCPGFIDPEVLWTCFQRSDTRQTSQYFAADGDNNYQWKLDSLNSSSTVWEVGANIGIFSKVMKKTYNPIMYLFEPVPDMVKGLRTMFQNDERVKIYPWAIARTTEPGFIYMGGINNEAASIFKSREGVTKDFGKTAPIPIQIKSFKEALLELGFSIENPVTLLQVNIEGGEYDLMDLIIEDGLAPIFKTIQVQYHTDPMPVVDGIYRHCRMQNLLNHTHRVVWDFNYVWERWALRF
jgi:FkbM family methyltransferase